MVAVKDGTTDEVRAHPRQLQPKTKRPGGGGNTGGGKGRDQRAQRRRSHEAGQLDMTTIQPQQARAGKARTFRSRALMDLSPAGRAATPGTRVFGVPHGARILVLSEKGMLGFAPRDLATHILHAWRGNGDAQLVGVVVAPARPSDPPRVRLSLTREAGTRRRDVGDVARARHGEPHRPDPSASTETTLQAREG